MFGWPKSKKASKYPNGTIIKFRRGLQNDHSPRYVLGIVRNCETSRKDWGDLLAVQIDGAERIHHIWTNNTEFVEMSDGEKMLFMMENS